MWRLSLGEKRFLLPVTVISSLCVALAVVRMITTGSLKYAFVIDNLALAWLAPTIGWILVRQLRVKPWLGWQNSLISALWLFMLPNTWYVLTDFIHVSTGNEMNQIYDIVMMMTLAFAGFALGYGTLYSLHREFLKRFPARISHGLVGVIILISSFAIYLGRDLRWNSWDLVTNTSGVILTVSDQVANPFGHPRAVNITVLFFAAIGLGYVAVWYALHPPKRLIN